MSYANQLEAKRNQPATAAQKAAFRKELSVRRAKANNKVRDLYQRSLATARDRRATQRDKVQRLRAERARDVAALKQDRKARLAAIETDRRAAVTRIDNQSAGRLANLTKNRATLQAKLDKAKKPAVRERLRQDIEAVNADIRAALDDKQLDVAAVNTRAANQRESAKEQFAARIARSKAQADATIQQVQQALREAFAARREAAQNRRTTDFQIVRAQYERGVTAIEKMPSPTDNGGGGGGNN